jgi:uncharacterized repeat protein (TIGR03803 family)
MCHVRAALTLGLVLTVAAPALAQVNYSEVFAFSDTNGAPKGALIQARNGYIYGTASRGGAPGRGSVFRMTVDGTFVEVAILQGATGEIPDAGIIEASDGNFYGVASHGGTGGFGTVFRMTQANVLTAIASFTGANGKYPEAELLEAPDGSLLGTTSAGGANDLGTVFRVTTSGAIATLVSFTGTNGSHPYAPLVRASDGNYYGTTRDGGSSGLGTIFKMTSAGTLTTVLPFTGTNGSRPYAGVLQASDGLLYGTTNTGGTNDAGTVFKVSTTGTLTTLTSFASTTAGLPLAGVIQGANNTLYGVTSGGSTNSSGFVFAVSAAGTVTSVQVLSQSGQSTGFNAQGELVLAANGYLYGTTSQGQVAAATGVVFRLPPPDLPTATSGFTTLFVFGYSQAMTPVAGVIEGGDGLLYGTASAPWSPGMSFGVVFTLTRQGGLNKLADLRQLVLAYPAAELTQGRDGLFYGGTAGTFSNSGFSGLFQVSPSGSSTRLYGFGAGESQNPSTLVETDDGTFLGVLRSPPACILSTSGCAPTSPPQWLIRITSAGQYSRFASPGNTSGALLDGNDGFFYGTTTSGGSNGGGTYFRSTSTGAVTVLGEFGAGEFAPAEGLTRGPDGAFYGIGVKNSLPMLFRLTSAGTIAAIAGTATGQAPTSRLTLHRDGSFYGVNATGGSQGLGAVIQVTPGGVFTTVFSFDSTTAQMPTGRLLSASDGNLYGTAPQGCTYNVGCVFRLGGPTVTVTPSSLYFGALSTGTLTSTGAQRLQIRQTGVGTFSWTATPTRPWIHVTPSSGVGPTDVMVTADPAGQPAGGTVTGQVAFALSGASNATASVDVTLTLRPAGATQAPFGLIDTPADGTTGLSGAIPVTGWALDDIGVSAVYVCRAAVVPESAPADGRCGGNKQIFIGAGTFVDGARPDVLAAFPTFPMASRAGWGLLVLTNVLPGGGNGPYSFFAYAVDQEGMVALLAKRTIGVDNAGSIAPFGTIDTPPGGATVSGVVTNFGWVLSPGTARADGAGGGTVDVTIDGVRVGSPVGWVSRPDLTATFPVSQYSGVNNALGLFSFDSRTLADGLHTIGWSVTDSMGRSAGVGSRFFTVANAAPSLTATALAPSLAVHASTAAFISFRRGFDADPALTVVTRGADGVFHVAAEEVERIEIQLWERGAWIGHQVSAAGAVTLPPGSAVDPETGVFTWQPGAGFLGSYVLVLTDTSRGATITVQVTLYPKGTLNR